MQQQMNSHVIPSVCEYMQQQDKRLMALCVYLNTDNGSNPFYSFNVTVTESAEGYAFKSMTKRAPCLHTVQEVNTQK